MFNFKSAFIGTGLLIALTFRANAQFDSSVLESPNRLTHHMTALFNKADITTGLLYQRAAPVVPLEHFEGKQTDSVAKPSQLEFMYKQLINMANDSDDIPAWDSIKSFYEYYSSKNQIPLVIFNCNYNRLHDSVWAWHLIDTNAYSQMIVNSQANMSPFITDRLNMVVPAFDMLGTGNTFTFILDSNLYFTNTGHRPTTIAVDFGDGQGMNSYSWGQTITVTWQSTGAKTIQVEYSNASNQTVYGKAGYMTDVTDNSNLQLAGQLSDIFPADQLETYMFVSDIGWGTPRNFVTGWTKQTVNSPLIGQFTSYFPSYGTTNKNSAAITVLKGKNANGSFHTCLTKPFILTDGIDFGYNKQYGGPNYYNPAFNKFGQLGLIEIYENYWHGGASDKKEIGEYTSGVNPVIRKQFGNGKELIDDLINHGYDVIFFDYAYSTDYMQRNAMLFASFIDHVNATKCGPEPIVVCGPSMGGQITRFALTWMEHENRPHCVREWIAFDSPHKGANVPLSLQLFSDYWGRKDYEPISSKCLDVIERKLSRPAAQQLLAYLYNTTNYGESQLRADFMSQLNSLGGYPKNCRKVSVINGANNLITQGFNAADEIFDLKVPYWLTYTMGAPKWMAIALFPGNLVQQVFMGNLKSKGYALSCNSNNLLFRADVSVHSDTKYVWGLQNNCNATDHVPGCYLTFGDMTNGVSLASVTDGVSTPLLNIGLEMKQDHIVFMPITTTLDIGTENFYTSNFMFDISQTDIVQTGQTPFDAYYAPNENQNHVEINGGNVSWVLKEVYANEQRFTELPFQPNAGTTHRIFNMGHGYLLYSYEIANNSAGANPELQVNGSIQLNLGESTDPMDNWGKTYKVITPDCGSNCVIGHGGSFILGDDNPDNNKAIVYIRKGSTLELRENSTLIIHNGSRLVIEADATLKVDFGALIDLRGSNSVIEINGTLLIKDGGEYKTTGDGYTLFKNTGTGNPIVTCATQGIALFEGTIGEKRMEIAPNTYPDISNVELQLLNCSVVMDNQSGLVPHSKVTIDGSVIQAKLGYTSKPIGIQLTDQLGTDLTIRNTEFSNLTYALNFAQNTNIPDLNLSGCSFTNCNYGVYCDYMAAVSISNSSFNTCNAGVYANTIQGEIQLLQTSFSNCAYAFNANFSSPFLVSWCSFSNCPNGLFSSATANVHPMLTIRCSDFTNCPLSIEGAELNISRNVHSSFLIPGAQFAGNYRGGKNVFTNSTIGLGHVWNWHLQNGNNDFKKINGWSGDYANGVVENPNITSTINVDNNHINTIIVGSWTPLSHLINGVWSNTSWTGFLYAQPYGGCSGLGGDDGDGLAPPPMAGEEDVVNPIIEMSMFPNPAKDEATILLSLPGEQLTSLSITDMTGRIVFTIAHTNLKKGKQQIPVNTSKWAAGIYYINLKTDKDRITQKLIIQH